MQCVRCGRVLNREDRRCPDCLASLANQEISQGEVAGHQIRELTRMTADDMRSRSSRRGAGVGALTGGLGMILALSLWCIVAGIIVGAFVGWVVAWRRWGQLRACLLFATLMAPVVATTAMMPPFGFLVASLVGVFIGMAVRLGDCD